MRNVCAIAFALLTAASSLVECGEIQFYLAWDQPAPPLVASMADADAAGGQILRVEVKGDHLEYDNGMPARFWGVGVTFSGGRRGGMPPDRETGARLAKKLKSLGFNHVRFVGFDNTAPEPFLTWKATGRLDSPTMDRFDRFVYELRKQGIYYSISINNSAVLLLEGVNGVRPNKASQLKLWRYKYLRNYMPEAIERIVAWYRAFYTHRNPYTGLTYAEDPANLYVSAANEDSLMEPFFRDFKILDEDAVSYLDRRYREYLQEKYGRIADAGDQWAREGRECDSGGRTEDGPLLLSARELPPECRARIKDTLEFLVLLEKKSAQSIRSVLEDAGYRGLFSVTNNWYGYLGLLSNLDVGNYTDLHGYFWHPRRIRRPGDIELVENRSWVASGKEIEEIDGEFSYPLSKGFRAAVIGRPIVFSEWGVGAWSEYQHEAPIIMMAYSAFQGYSVLDAHTYFNHPNPDPREEIIRQALSVGVNPVIVALSPSLSLAYRRGDIRTPDSAQIHHCANSREEFLQKLYRFGLTKAGKICDYRSSEGYVEKIRVRLYGKGASGINNRNARMNDRVLKSSTGQIVWKRRPAQSAYFKVDAPRFFAALTADGGGKVPGSRVSATLHGKGAFTLISLDGKLLAHSSSMLATVAGSFANRGMRRVRMGGGVAVLDPGSGPPVMEIPEVDVDLPRPAEGGRVVCAVFPNGRMRRLASHVSADGHVERLRIGMAGTPWYWIGKVAGGGACADS